MIGKLNRVFVLISGLIVLGTPAYAQQPAQGISDQDPGADIIAKAPDSDWRRIEPENLLKITTTQGIAWVELADAFAPAHTTRMRELARQDWYDFKVWHRVITGFMAQGGGAIDNPSVKSPTEPIEGEFTIRRNPYELEITEIQERVVNPRSDRTKQMAGFWNGFQAGTERAAAAAIMGDGYVTSWLLHCKGSAAMARTSDPNSANAQFYIVTGEASHLNAQYTVWGKVRAGQDAIDGLAVGTIGEGIGFFPDIIKDVEVASDLEASERASIEVMDTRSSSFAAYLETLKTANGRLPDVCDITIPVRISQ